MAPEEELEWFLRDRKDHVARIIVPALQQKRIVILDRYYLSTIAYQGSLGIDPLVIETKNREFAPEPAILFLIDITPCAGVQRKKQNAHGKTDTFEQEKYLSTVSAMFSKYHRPFVRRLRGDEYVQTLANQTWEITMQYLVEHDLVISPSGNPLIKKRRCNYG